MVGVDNRVMVQTKWPTANAAGSATPDIFRPGTAAPADARKDTKPEAAPSSSGTSSVRDWIEGALQGEFNENMSFGQQLFDGVVTSINPIVGGSAAARDITAIEQRIKERQARGQGGARFVDRMGQALAMAGAIPLVGGVVKVGGKVAVKAVQAGMEASTKMVAHAADEAATKAVTHATVEAAEKAGARAATRDLSDLFKATHSGGITKVQYLDPATGHGVTASVNEAGEMRMLYKANEAMRAEHGTGREMYNSALKALEKAGAKVKTIVSEWPGDAGVKGNSTNYATYRESIAKGRTPEQAAFNTPAGRVSAENGFSRIEDIWDMGQMAVEVRFVRP